MERYKNIDSIMTIANNNGMIGTFSSDEDDEDCPSDSSTVHHDEEHRPKRTHTHEDSIRFIKISTAVLMFTSVNFQILVPILTLMLTVNYNQQGIYTAMCNYLANLQVSFFIL